MATPRKHARLIIGSIVVALIAVALTAAFWPRAILVDFGSVTRGPMMLTIDEVGRTQVREPFVVATPVAGRLKRVQVHPGDPVVRGETVVAHMLPINPAALDARTREQADAAVSAANAALRVANADLKVAQANYDLAQSELARTIRLHDSDLVSDAALDRAEQSGRVAEAAVDMAQAAIAVREAGLLNAQAQLISFDDPALAAAIEGDRPDDIPLFAPATGRILRIIQESETTLPAGSPIMEIGNIETDLEVVVELVSADAVRASPGDRVIIEGWGGDHPLAGRVVRVDPNGFTKTSALGVEEQRVPLTIELTSDTAEYDGLGHGFRVEVRIVIWEDQTALRVPASALFRIRDDWAVFVLDGGRAQQRIIAIDRNNGTDARVLSGLIEADQVVLYPSAAIADGSRVASRANP